MVKINFLKVNNGDAIHISYNFDSKPVNIVIDSGSRQTYTREEKEQRPPRKTIIIDGEFKNLIKTLKDKKEVINLLIITHVDDDHIGGVLQWMESIEFDNSMVEKIWFNSGQLINEYFNKNLENNKNNSISLTEFKSISQKTSISDGVCFENKMLEYDIWDRKIIKAGDTYEEFGAKFLILSPTERNLTRLLTKWEKEKPSSVKTSDSENLEYQQTLKELLNNDKTSYDSSKHNGSSIAFILEVENKSLLFLGDCLNQTILKSMKKFKIDSIRVDMVKISHHGSKNNTSNKLLQKIECNKYVISTDGNSHNHPNKITLARIINNNPNCEIYLNYIGLKDKIFKDKDYEDYNFSVLSTDELIV